VPGKVPATPAARRLAERRGLALESVTGSGPYGAVRLRDLARPAPAAAQAAPAGGEPERMIRSRQVPCATLLAKADVTELVETHRLLNEGQELRVSYTDLVLKAVAIALREHPEIVYHQRIDIGLAVALEDGLIVPVVRGVDGLALRQLAARTRELAARARERRLGAEETKGGTFAVSDLGMYGIASFSPLLNPPESAALGVGAVEEVPRLGAGGRLESRMFMELCLTHDQRQITEAQAARFLARVRLLLENPCALLAS
jgi:pyruvate dehydrogenase E2 component (dihydrolipoamide acetyltransferase)